MEVPHVKQLLYHKRFGKLRAVCSQGVIKLCLKLKQQGRSITDLDHSSLGT